MWLVLRSSLKPGSSQPGSHCVVVDTRVWHLFLTAPSPQPSREPRGPPWTLFLLSQANPASMAFCPNTFPGPLQGFPVSISTGEGPCPCSAKVLVASAFYSPSCPRKWQSTPVSAIASSVPGPWWFLLKGVGCQSAEETPHKTRASCLSFYPKPPWPVSGT